MAVNNGKKVLIFGASGFVGKYLADELMQNGYEVYGSDITDKTNLPGTVVYYKVDLLDCKAVESIVRKADPEIIINLAAISSVGASWSIPQTTIQVNVVGTLNILESVRKHNPGIKTLLVGSSEEYVVSDYPMSEDRPLDATNPYGISKVTQEYFAKMYKERYDLKIYCVRSFNHTGIGQRDSFVLPSWCKQVANIDKSGKSGVLKVGNLDVKRDFSHVKDVVRAYRMIVESDNYSIVYNVGSGKSHSLHEMLDYIIGLSDQKIDIEVEPDRIRPTDQPMICCDFSLIRSQLGWEPQLTVFDALNEMYSFYKR